MRSARANRQHGAALLLLLAVVVLGSSWYLVSRLKVESGMANAARTARNTEVLNKAKQALIGYVAAQAVKAGENNPGAMPCPENPADFDDTNGLQGRVGSSCGVTTVGRFPWKTLGLDQLVDASGEPLWYVVGPNWGVLSGSNTVINSDSLGQLNVDGVANDSIALIIAPGPAFKTPAATGCTAWNQVRPATGTPDWRNYLECENATSPADATFVTFKSPIVDPTTKAVTPVFNDQVVKITVADVMPAIEAAIANRIEREIVPSLNTVYTPSVWGFSGSNPVYPYAAPFANPGPGTGTSSYQGSAGTYAGLLPFFQTVNCTPSASNPRCNTSLLVFSKSGNDTQVSGGGSIRTQSSCSWSSSVYVCTGEYNNTTVSLIFRLRVTNVAMGLRKLDTSKVVVTAMNDTTGGWGTQTISSTTTAALNTDGSATLTVTTGLMPDITAAGWGTYANYVISIDRAAIGDHALLDTTDAAVGWFARNEWFRQTYYAVAPAYATGNTASLRLPPNCTTGSTGVAANDCLTVSNVAPASAQRAILILGGRSVNSTSRPSATLADYLESGNATSAYTRKTVSAAAVTPAAQRFNDRIVVIGTN
jgi:hypothetical protein